VNVDAFVDELLGADRDAALARVDGHLAAGTSAEELVDGLLAPALVEVGRRWEAAETSIGESQAAERIVQAALARAAPTSTAAGRPAVRTRSGVTVCSPVGEAHELPGQMLGEVLRAHGWVTETLGSVPARDVHEYLSRRRPAALLLSCTTPCSLPGAARAIEAARQAGVAAIAGGAGFGPDDRRARRLAAAAWAPSAAAAIAVLEKWRRASPTLAAGGDLDEEYLVFEACLAEIRAAVLAGVRRTDVGRRDDPDDGTTDEHIELLLRHVGAGVLVDEDEVLVDHVSWRVGYLRARQQPTDGLAAVLDAVEAAMPGNPGRARRVAQAGLRHLELLRRRTPASVVLRGQPDQPSSGPADAPHRQIAPTEVQQGQVFADLLLLAALACHAPMALISVAQPDGQWSTLSYGGERRETLADVALFAAVADRRDPLELVDLARYPDWRASPLAAGPQAVRYVHGIPLRGADGPALGVFCILDRRVRGLNRRERQAVVAVARQVTDQIVLWRRVTGPRPEPPPVHRRRSSDRGGGDRPGPDAALVDLVGLRRGRAGADQHLLRSHEVAVLFDVTERTVINWAAARRLPSLRTAGGHLRFRSEDVLSLLARRSTSGTGQPS
jgi:excisionase family DNA binding protein